MCILFVLCRFVQTLGGRYVTACDVGTSVHDLDLVGETTAYATGRSRERGGCGDSSVLTAYGVYQGMRAAAEHVLARMARERGILTVGASASIFGLLGALVYYGRRGGSRLVYSQAMTYAVMMFVFGLMMHGIDNYAHAGGFLGGWLAGRVLDPLHPERINHMLIAVILLALSILSILVSLLMPVGPPLC